MSNVCCASCEEKSEGGSAAATKEVGAAMTEATKEVEATMAEATKEVAAAMAEADDLHEEEVAKRKSEHRGVKSLIAIHRGVNSLMNAVEAEPSDIVPEK